MQKAEKKPKWTKPKLIVLVRGKPEESVLQGCKTRDGGGPEGDAGACGGWYNPECPMRCEQFPSS